MRSIVTSKTSILHNCFFMPYRPARGPADNHREHKASRKTSKTSLAHVTAGIDDERATVLLVHTGHDAEHLGPDDHRREHCVNSILSREAARNMPLPMSTTSAGRGSSGASSSSSSFSSEKKKRAGRTPNVLPGQTPKHLLKLFLHPSPSPAPTQPVGRGRRGSSRPECHHPRGAAVTAKEHHQNPGAKAPGASPAPPALQARRGASQLHWRSSVFVGLRSVHLAPHHSCYAESLRQCHPHGHPLVSQERAEPAGPAPLSSASSACNHGLPA